VEAAGLEAARVRDIPAHPVGEFVAYAGRPGERRERVSERPIVDEQRPAIRDRFGRERVRVRQGLREEVEHRSLEGLAVFGVTKPAAELEPVGGLYRDLTERRQRAGFKVRELQ